MRSKAMSDSIRGGVILLLILFVLLMVTSTIGKADRTVQVTEYPYNAYTEQVVGITYYQGERYEVVETTKTSRHLRK